MNVERLLKHYEHIADAQDAIARLRRFILGLAVRGKLVPQDPNDEPASELLERVVTGRARLAHERKALKPVDAGPFEIPSTWAWARLGTISQLVRGISFPASAKSEAPAQGLLPCFRSGNIQAETVWDEFVYVPMECINIDTQLVRRGDILISIANSYELVGKCSIVSEVPYAATFGAFLAAIRLEQVLPAYIKVFLTCEHSLSAFRTSSAQTTNIANITFLTIRNHCVPVPPAAEQHRIVAKVDELMALCEMLEETQKHREATRDRLTAASLARLNAPDPETFQADARFAIEELPALTARTDQIERLRETIRSLAIRGQLGSQDQSDESASELLQRIRYEKAKASAGKSRELRAITDTERPFAAPPGWAWVRMGDIFSIRTGYAFKSSSYAKEGTLVFRVTNFDRNGRFDLSDSVYFPSDKIDAKLSKFLLTPGETIMVMVGGTIGKTTIVNETLLPALLNQNMWRIRSFGGLMVPRFEYLLVRGTNQLIQGLTRSTHGHFAMRDYEMRLVLLPPLSEQLRIVAKVDQLMAACDRLQASLVNADDTRLRLLDALLHETLAGSSSNAPHVPHAGSVTAPVAVVGPATLAPI
jgi:type I restriction enzyme S subunit